MQRALTALALRPELREAQFELVCVPQGLGVDVRSARDAVRAQRTFCVRPSKRSFTSEALEGFHRKLHESDAGGWGRLGYAPRVVSAQQGLFWVRNDRFEQAL